MSLTKYVGLELDELREEAKQLHGESLKIIDALPDDTAKTYQKIEFMRARLMDNTFMRFGTVRGLTFALAEEVSSGLPSAERIQKLMATTSELIKEPPMAEESDEAAAKRQKKDDQAS